MNSRLTLPRLYLRMPNGEFVEIEEDDALIVLRADGTEEVYLPTNDDFESDDGDVSLPGAKAVACAQLLSDPVALTEYLDGMDILCELLEDDDADQG